jgi:hypothetical protein
MTVVAWKSDRQLAKRNAFSSPWALICQSLP